ncbi:HNH endonuclease [Candidatus Kaiserbacteria bacterium CG10_big_fil_rev_8_21_14_0_10_49_17]|uniref:HNH endonuclease n=1 Tax=Candidatus Kaiserbacteria bacterium CG10_big_fil_rev_8_21_14_0_10_49_17 TaxID=1974609 RepID=A0A2M6WFJ5_9BACT|nr:MAG: HNH endonuclease [Candidatus Kaiserbacteria bacterium CG10_big_fil_rev_8_21_14_0_10_49_17]
MGKQKQRPRSWTTNQLVVAVRTSTSVRQVLLKLGLQPAGGNYTQIHLYIREMGLSTDHFLGQGWSRGLKDRVGNGRPLREILRKNSDYQSFKLKKRLFREGLKREQCELCGWNKRAPDGRLPLELDHINGDKRDNRLENLQILCPNCHSLQPTHRGMNKRKRRDGEIGKHATLKMS